jgi:transposase
VPYSDAFKQQMVKKMLGPPAVSATELSKKVGVPQPTLSKWLVHSRNLAAAMSTPPDSKVSPPSPQSPRRWTPEEKLRVVSAAQGLTGEALGALLRREGLHEAQLEEWRAAAAGALASSGAADALPPQARKKLWAAEKRVKELERELRRKDRALAETAAMLVLEKKLKSLGWDAPAEEEDEESAPSGRSEK